MTQEHDHDPELHEVVSRLESERPIPRAAFRGDLRRRLLQRPDGWRAAPAALRRQIFAYAGSGAALLAVAIAGVAGAGPFSA